MERRDNMYTVILKRNEEKRIIDGHPWIFANEVSKIEGKDKQGSIAKVQSFDKRFIGYGYINHTSKIIVRMLTNNETVIDYDFFYQRIKSANDFRVNLGYDNNYRVVFGEADLIPGLVVDKYDKYLSVQILSLGIEVIKEMIIKILVDIFKPIGIYERSDVSVRKNEGLKEFKGTIYGDVPDKVMIIENDIKINIDIKNGQKTGYFLDQKENRDNLKYYVKEKSVLDCFCNIGGFSLCASKYGASEITAIDSSKSAIDMVNENAQLNGYTNIKTLEANVFEQLRVYKNDKKKFDIIILDPPAFIKRKDKVKEGYKGYRDINILALKQINKGGFLITCSCSKHLSINMFLNMVMESCIKAKVPAKIVEFRMQSKDHATQISMEESLYLKVAVVSII